MAVAQKGFGRDKGTVEPAFVPSKGYKPQPIGSADAQVVEAMRISKERNKKLAKHEETMGMSERIVRMDNLTVQQAIEFLDSLSQVERERYLKAERLSKDRKTIMASYGWE